MSKLLSFQTTIATELEKLEKEYLPTRPANLYDPIKYTLSLGGKRMRPLLVMIGCDLFDGNTEEALPAAIAVELFHNFTLIHDDIMDNAPLRRNKQTIHEKWNNNVAILGGDAMMVKAYEYLAKTKPELLPGILKVFNSIALQVCEGQQLDMDYEKQFSVASAQYMNMITLKTAVLLAGSLKMGAIIGGARNEDADRLYEFGKNIGIAFQLQDDILDVYADAASFGKQKGGDIISNKKTFLLIKALELSNLNSYKKEELLQWIHAPQFIPQEKVEAVTEIYNFLNVKKIAEVEMDKYYRSALQYLHQIPVNEEKINELAVFTEGLMSRGN